MEKIKVSAEFGGKTYAVEVDPEGFDSEQETQAAAVVGEIPHLEERTRFRGVRSAIWLALFKAGYVPLEDPFGFHYEQRNDGSSPLHVIFRRKAEDLG